MAKLDYEIKPIAMDEWLPDRCMGYGKAVDPKRLRPAPGCNSLSIFYTNGDRKKLETLYTKTIAAYGCCGFIAWLGRRVVGYNTFFPRTIAARIKFYGWGTDEDIDESTLVHNCITLRGDPAYRRQGIGSSLIRASLKWGKEHGWQRFEVHLVLPDDPSHWIDEQKSCVTFWRKLGLEVYRTHENFERLQSHAGQKGVTIETTEEADAYRSDWRDTYYYHSMAVDLQRWGETDY